MHMYRACDAHAVNTHPVARTRLQAEQWLCDGQLGIIVYVMLSQQRQHMHLTAVAVARLCEGGCCGIERLSQERRQTPRIRGKDRADLLGVAFV